MSKNNEFNNILDECLERLINGETIEACLAEYPGYAAELEPLLRTVMDARQAAAIEPRPEFRDRARYDFQAAIRDMESVKSPGFLKWFPRWATVVTSVVIVILLSVTGTVAASTNSLPDEPLYQVKLATEAVRLAFTPSALGKAELYATFADERVEEIIRMADEGKIEQVEKATERMNDQLIAMSNLFMPDGAEDAQMEMATFEAAEAAPAPMVAEETPTPIPAPRPAPAPSPAPEPEPEVAQVPVDAPAPAVGIPPEAVEEVPVMAAPRATGPREDTGRDKERGRADKVTKPERQARLIEIVSEQAIENSKKLQELLEEAPESLKPALLRALKVVGNGYEDVLRNLE